MELQMSSLDKVDGVVGLEMAELLDEDQYRKEMQNWVLLIR